MTDVRACPVLPVGAKYWDEMSSAAARRKDVKGPMSVSITVESSTFAFSAASFSRWSAIRSLERSMPSLFLNSATIQSMTR